MGQVERKVIVHDVLPKVKVHDVLPKDNNMQYRKVRHYAEQTVTLNEKCGLYIDIYYPSPALKLTQAAHMFESQVKIIAKGKTVDAKSILLVASLGVKYGEEMTICAEGIDA